MTPQYVLHKERLILAPPIAMCAQHPPSAAKCFGSSPIKERADICIEIRPTRVLPSRRLADRSMFLRGGGERRAERRRRSTGFWAAPETTLKRPLPRLAHTCTTVAMVCRRLALPRAGLRVHCKPTCLIRIPLTRLLPCSLRRTCHCRARCAQRRPKTILTHDMKNQSATGRSRPAPCVRAACPHADPAAAQGMRTLHTLLTETARAKVRRADVEHGQLLPMWVGPGPTSVQTSPNSGDYGQSPTGVDPISAKFGPASAKLRQ